MILESSEAAYCLKTDKGEIGEHPRVAVDEGDDSEGGRAIVCEACGFAITAENHRIAIDDSHRHTFFNPSGIVYELGCFSRAPGCSITGEATSEFTWFAGYRWRFALCGKCREHLGWRYESAAGSFFGLILSKLRE